MMQLFFVCVCVFYFPLPLGQTANQLSEMHSREEEEEEGRGGREGEDFTPPLIHPSPPEISPRPSGSSL